ncbi:MAG: hypothetical protein ACLP8X_01635 [Streptosporangiaceae bacterium]
MSSDHEAEIRASVAAHADLGPGYDDAVAEGLVERIGAEIDKRIDARLGQSGTVRAPGPPAGAGGAAGAAGLPGPAGPEGAGSPGPAAPGYQGYQAPAGYQGYQGYMGPLLPPGYQMGPPPVRPSSAGQRNVATTITALGSMALGVAATAIVSHDNHSGGQAFMVLLIWAAIAVINVAYARRP